MFYWMYWKGCMYFLTLRGLNGMRWNSSFKKGYLARWRLKEMLLVCPRWDAWLFLCDSFTFIFQMTTEGTMNTLQIQTWTFVFKQGRVKLGLRLCALSTGPSSQFGFRISPVLCFQVSQSQWRTVDKHGILKPHCLHLNVYPMYHLGSVPVYL